MGIRGALSRRRQVGALTLKCIQSIAEGQVLDIGCGPGSLLELLVIPPLTVAESPIRSSAKGSSHLPSPVDSDDEDEDFGLFLDVRALFLSTSLFLVGPNCELGLTCSGLPASTPHHP